MYKTAMLVVTICMAIAAFFLLPPHSPSHLRQTATPATDDLAIADIFFTRLSEDCSLPCWNNLNVGMSSEQELLEGLRNLDFESGILDTPPAPRNYIAWLTYHDMYDGDVLSRVRVEGFVDEGTLRGLSIYWSDLFVTEMPPQRVLAEMGTPTNVYVGLGSGTNYVSTRLWLEYPEVNTYFIYETAVFFEEPYTLCLNPQGWIDENLSIGLKTVILDAESGVMRLFLLRRSKTGFDIAALEDATGYTPEAFTNYVLREENPCIEIDGDSLVYYE